VTTPATRTDHLFLTELIGLKVFDLKGRRIGRVRDAALVPVINPARVDRFLVGGGWSWLTVRHDQVASISLDGIWLRGEQLTPYHDDEYMLRIVRDLLDHQIIDGQGRRVVRVSDVTFVISQDGDHDQLLVSEVDVGIRAVLRRVVRGGLPRRWVRWLQRPVPPRSIPWEACNIIERDPQRRLRLNISSDRLETIHPADLADIVEELGPDDREAILGSVDSEVAAETLSEVEPRVQAQIVQALGAERAADIIEEMAPDEAADLLAGIREETSAEILEEMDSAPKADVRQLLKFKDSTAGGMMNLESVILPARLTVAGAWGALVRQQELLEELNTVFLTEDGRRVSAMVPLARLVLAADETRLFELATERLVSVGPTESWEEVAELFDKYNLVALPVVDESGALLGAITADDVIAVLRER
jgi:sporulation protein YlmC with PRC-barrel domain